MRAEAPVRWNPSRGGGGFWSITRHADIAHVSSRPELFSSAAAGVLLHKDQVLPLEVNRNMLLYMDPPRHTKYRKILHAAFTPRVIGALEDSVRMQVTQLLDGAIESGSCDWVKQVAVPLPLRVLTTMMGLPDEDFDRIHAWSESLGEATRAVQPAAAVDVVAEMGDYVQREIHRQAAAGVVESLVMRLRHGEVDGGRLTDDEIAVVFGLLVFAGNDTTRNTAAAGLDVLLDHPNQWRMLCADRALIAPAVEELLRYTSVVQFFKRTAMVDISLGGRLIKAGDPLILWYTSGSRDESVYEDPQRFDITRKNNDHMAFGGGGRHFCLAAGLARLEPRVLLEETARRMPDIERDGQIQREPSPWAHIVTSVPIRFTPGNKSV